VNPDKQVAASRKRLLGGRRPIDNAACPIARTLEIVGEPWTLLVLREAFRGVRRFSDFQSFLKIPKATLTDRLGKLVKHSLLRKEIYQEPGARLREEYWLTSKAVDLLPALVALMRWGNMHLGLTSINIVVRETGSAVRAVLVDEQGKAVHHKDMAVAQEAARKQNGEVQEGRASPPSKKGQKRKGVK
jgi:DNA-binding HxlR family transcriptional regulator